MNSHASLQHARGSFNVEVKPQTPDNPAAEGSGLARLSLRKQFQGDLEGSGQGEMLGAGDGKTSGGYVALEKISGTLAGHKGSFVMIHRALMVGGVPTEWTIDVVPDSGTEDLKGLSGSMKIVIADGKHHYEFTYSLANG
ncbi:hypothetical protein BJI69_19095 [Luteibacter rhizovicinus DSM 16549]|uniref:Uncharacterized protein n=1 Tax=Luteibacter rhizovicinus DSM 16549 TaxID=1440763 RepID=A0A0G9HC89_9GAMM|nr:DUF3224 domain-containing protein [Luteibacter rhizovicinus]APG05802.1 hypothetical protein BJI69_19095 [Luteibacter rhizovicinus DSM 16549]KLD67248.1 hypothetical protein Y883_09910 [Luteibacter rhizovicinus DSM 16549]